MHHRPVLGNEALDLDAPISWGCSARGWNCCVGTLIPVRPFDMLGLCRSTGRAAHHLIEDGTVSLEWDGAGILVGWLAQREHPDGAMACTFYEELTAAEARAIERREPKRFEALPASVRQEAARAGDTERIAGLCGVHEGRPEACRAFPFQRDPLWRDWPGRAAIRISDCGSCAVAQPTTPREVMLDNGLLDYWRADEAYRAVVGYLHGMGLARTRAPGYRPAQVAPADRDRLWRVMYEAGSGAGEKDATADLPAFASILRATLATAEELVGRAGVERAHLGPPGPAPERPDLDALLSSRAILPD